MTTAVFTSLRIFGTFGIAGLAVKVVLAPTVVFVAIAVFAAGVKSRLGCTTALYDAWALKLTRFPGVHIFALMLVHAVTFRVFITRSAVVANRCWPSIEARAHFLTGEASITGIA